MRLLSKSLGFIAILGTATALHADVGGPAPAPPPAVGTVDTTATAPDLTMSAEEMQARASEMKVQADEAYRTVLSLKEQALKQKDVIKLNCVNQRLLLMKAQMNIQEGQNQDLQVALSSKTDDRVVPYGKLKSTSDAIIQLRDDAKGCVGTPELYKQESGIIVTHPDLPDKPGDGNPFELPIEPPAYASPFR